MYYVHKDIVYRMMQALSNEHALLMYVNSEKYVRSDRKRKYLMSDRTLDVQTSTCWYTLQLTSFDRA